MFVISKIASPESLRNATLRDRATRAHCGRSLEFVAFAGKEEAGFLSYEDWSDRASAFVYEIFVLPSYRRQGLGSALLLHAEGIAAQLKCEHIRLKPHALDENPDQSRLKAWYSSQGYREDADDPEHMHKPLQKRGKA